MTRALLLALALATAGCSSDGKVREPAELKDIANAALQPARVWTGHAGAGADEGYTGLRLAVEADALFAADVAGRVYAFEPQTGKSIWRAETGARVVAGPSVSGNAVLVGTLDGEVIALRRADGDRLWQAKLSSEVMAAPAGDGDLVVARSVDGKLFGLSAVSGAQKWSFDRSVPNLTVRGLSEPLLYGGRVFLGLDNGRVAALQASDGKPVWEQAIALPSGRNELERLTDVDGHLLAEGREIYAVSFGGELACLDGETGQVLWRRSVKGHTGAALSGDLVVAADEAGIVWALDARTGAAAWKQEDLRYRKLSPPAAFGGWIVVGDFEGYLHWLDPKDGRIVARNRPASDPIQAAPVVAGDLLYVMDVSGRIAALGVR